MQKQEQLEPGVVKQRQSNTLPRLSLPMSAKASPLQKIKVRNLTHPIHVVHGIPT